MLILGTIILRDRNRAHELMAVKSKDWQYEDEVRIIRPKYGPQTFEKRILRKVIFGVHTPIDVREKFRQLTADEGYTNVEFFECLLKNGDFGLTLHSINMQFSPTALRLIRPAHLLPALCARGTSRHTGGCVE